jgi:hypothetical protein
MIMFKFSSSLLKEAEMQDAMTILATQLAKRFHQDNSHAMASSSNVLAHHHRRLRSHLMSKGSTGDRDYDV